MDDSDAGADDVPLVIGGAEVNRTRSKRSARSTGTDRVFGRLVAHVVAHGGNPLRFSVECVRVRLINHFVAMVAVEVADVRIA